jgi:hypothetical protein
VKYGGAKKGDDEKYTAMVQKAEVAIYDSCDVAVPGVGR